MKDRWSNVLCRGALAVALAFAGAAAACGSTDDNGTEGGEGPDGAEGDGQGGDAHDGDSAEGDSVDASEGGDDGGEGGGEGGDAGGDDTGGDSHDGGDSDGGDSSVADGDVGPDTGEEGGAGSVVINEIVYTTVDGSADFMELYNPGDAPADISGYIFRDDDDSHSFVFPEGTIIEPDGFLVAYGPGAEGSLVFDFGLGANDAARLFAAEGGIVDQVSWSGGVAPPGRAYGRSPDGTGNFFMLESPTPGAPNAAPVLNPPSWPPLLISEVVASALDGGPDWAEIHNPTGAAVSLAGWRITDKPNSAPETWTEVGDVEVPAGGYVLLWGPGAPEGSDFEFGLGAGDRFRLASPDYVTIDDVQWKPGWAPTGFSYGRHPDELDEWLTLDTPTPGAQNVAPMAVGDAIPPNTLVISEIMADPAAVSGTDGEWLEIVNSGPTSLDINGLLIADDGGSSHRIDAGEPWIVAPGQRAMLFRNADPSKNGGAGAGYEYGAAIAFGNSADSVVILSRGKELDRVDYDVAQGWPLVPGASIQLDPAATKPIPNDFASNWCASTNVYGQGDKGTPGSPNKSCID